MASNKTPRVCPVTGTGDPGTGIAICASNERNATPAITKPALVRTVLRGKTAVRSVVVAIDISCALS